MRWRNERLPIHDVLPEVLRHVREDPAMLLHAPTGAGKTTVVPLAVLEAGAVAGKILVLQPRRITCMSVARRMAYLSGEPLGEFVGYRIRHDTVVSNRTRIEVVTDGVLVRLLHQNPTLEGYGAVFFDEFHERNIESDLSFSLCLAAHRANNCRFKLVIMSATFGNLAESLRNILGKVGTVRSEGTTFPVEVRHVDLVADLNNYEPEGPQKFAEQVAGVIQGALGEHTGDVLVFLPGEREIMYTWIALNNMGIGDGQVPRNLAGWARKLIDRKAADLGRRIVVHTLYGTLDQGEQDEALSPPPQGWRKVILATPIAESSITVPGVRVVVDAGLKRIKVEDPVACTSTMETVPISITSADQRKGRAGRVSEGVCYRLWSERHHERLQQNDTPEIHRSDLSPCLLDLSVQGYVSDDQIAALPWVDPPKVEDLGIARELLARLRGVEKRPDGGWALTVRGRQLAQFPVHPRLAHAILQAAHVSESFARDACDLAALMEEKELLRGGRPRHGGDLEARLDALQSKKNRDVIWAVRERVLMASEQLQRIAGLGTVESGRRQSASERRSLCVLLAWAFPELLARAERGGGSGGQRRYRMRYSQLATLDGRDPLAKERDLAIASLTGNRIFWALRMDPELLPKYGIDPENAGAHRVYSRAPAGGAGLPVVLQRYLAGKDCAGVASSEELVGSLARDSAQWPPAEVDAMLWDLAWAEPAQVGLMQSLARRVVTPRASEFEASQLARVACAMVIAGIRDDDIFNDIATAITPRIGELVLDSEGGNLCSLLWAYTEVGVSNADLFAALASRACSEMGAFKPTVLSSVRNVCFWSFHRASSDSWSNKRRKGRSGGDKGFASKDFFKALSPIVIRSLAEIHPITCVYLMWSYSKGGVNDPELFNAIAKHVGPRAKDLDRCGVTMFCWNYAYIGAENEGVYRHVRDDCMRPERMAEMAPRDTACMLWAFAKAGVRDRELADALVDQSYGLLRDGMVQGCYRGPAKSLKRDIYVGDLSAVDGAVDSFDITNLGDMLVGLVDLQMAPTSFLELVDEYVANGLDQEDRLIERFVGYPKAKGVAKVLHALAQLDTGSDRLLRAAGPYCLRHLRDLSSGDVISLLWTWAVRGLRSDTVVADLHLHLREQLLGRRVRGVTGKQASSALFALRELGIDDEELRGVLTGPP